MDKVTDNLFCSYVKSLETQLPRKRPFFNKSLGNNRTMVKLTNVVLGVVGSHPEVTRLRPKCLPRQAPGSLGIMLTDIKVWDRALRRCAVDWVIVFEDDARPEHPRLAEVLRSTLLAKPAPQVVWLDERNRHVGPWPSPCCLVAMAYHKSTLPALIEHHDLGNTAALWSNYSQKVKRVMNQRLMPIGAPAKLLYYSRAILCLLNKSRPFPEFTHAAD